MRYIGTVYGLHYVAIVSAPFPGVTAHGLIIYIHMSTASLDISNPTMLCTVTSHGRPTRGDIHWLCYSGYEMHLECDADLTLRIMMLNGLRQSYSTVGREETATKKETIRSFKRCIVFCLLCFVSWCRILDLDLDLDLNHDHDQHKHLPEIEINFHQ